MKLYIYSKGNIPKTNDNSLREAAKKKKKNLNGLAIKEGWGGGVKDRPLRKNTFFWHLKIKII